MEHKNYVVKKRARFTGISGDVNIPYGAHLEAQNGYLLWDGKPVCAANSQNGLDHFANNDDGRGEERGRLTTEIISMLIKRNENYQARWNKVWEDKLCQKYRMAEHEDYWFWNCEFYAAPIEDLQYIRKLITI